MNQPFQRPSQRQARDLRPVTVTRSFTKHAEGSVLIEFGDTKVLCTASVLEKVPPHQKGSGEGWVTAEYGMLPRSTHTRSDREAARGKQSGRTQEIQRLIGRAMRSVFDLKALGERTIHLDCDVLQADGGTRTAAITGAYVAARDAVNLLLKNKAITSDPILDSVAAISVGIYQGVPVLDLDYAEDSAKSKSAASQLPLQQQRHSGKGWPVTILSIESILLIHQDTLTLLLKLNDQCAY